MDLDNLYRLALEENTSRPSDWIKIFGWFLHTAKAQETFSASDVANCFDIIHLKRPTNISTQLNALVRKKPPDVLKNKSGFRLSADARNKLDALYGSRPSAIYVSTLLSNLTENITDESERIYLDETIICYRYGAFRAAIVMCWNLVYDHMCNFILKYHLTAFNQQLLKSFPKANLEKIASRDDFQVLNEHQVIQVAKSASIIDNNTSKILFEKLVRRNIAAHPSTIKISPATTEEFIRDSVDNLLIRIIVNS